LSDLCIEQAWCPSCLEWTVIDVGRPCAFCDTILVRKRGGWKRPDRYRFTRRELETIAALHARGASLRAIARGLWQRMGYSTEHSCLGSMLDALHREGLRVRTHSQATAMANRARSKRLPGEDKNAYKRRVRRERGYRDSRTGEWRIVRPRSGASNQ
jgi:hypothetical protein